MVYDHEISVLFPQSSLAMQVHVSTYPLGQPGKVYTISFVQD